MERSTISRMRPTFAVMPTTHRESAGRRTRCVVGITANVGRMREMVDRSIGLVTALNPYIGYEAATRLGQVEGSRMVSSWDAVNRPRSRTRDATSEPDSSASAASRVAAS